MAFRNTLQERRVKMTRRQAAMLQRQVEQLIVLVQQQDARRYAEAIRSTWLRHARGFMATSTCRRHVESLWGTIDARGLRVLVELELGINR